MNFIFTFVNMRAVLYFSSLLCLLFTSACKSKSNLLCECIEKSEALNEMSNILLFEEQVSEEQQNALFALRKEIDSLCEPFKMMGTEQLYELRNECIDPELLELNK